MSRPMAAGNRCPEKVARASQLDYLTHSWGKIVDMVGRVHSPVGLHMSTLGLLLLRDPLLFSLRSSMLNNYHGVPRGGIATVLSQAEAIDQKGGAYEVCPLFAPCRTQDLSSQIYL